jgi:uncharacterized protein (DUF433 family)
MKKAAVLIRPERLRKVVERTADGELYEYYPLGTHVVIAPGVCGGRPTFKGTRVEVRVILDWLRAGQSVPQILENFPRLSQPAIEESIALATQAFNEQFALRAA